MKKIFILPCLLALLAASVLADQSVSESDTYNVTRDQAALDVSACDPCKPIDCFEDGCDTDKFFPVFGKNHKRIFDNFEVNGWIQAGVFANSHGTTTRRNKIPNADNRLTTVFDADSGNSYYFGNVHSTDVQINQLWLELKKEADGKHGLDWGFVGGVFFGTDAVFSQSYSDAKFDYGWQSGDYFTAIPVLYFQLAYGNLSLKVGKFETYLGYEALRAPDTIFYSHPYSFMFEPTTHSGVLAEYKPTDKLQFVFAYTMGTGSSFENAFGDNGFLGSVSYQLTDKLNLSYTAEFERYGGGIYKNHSARDFANNNQFMHTLVASYDISDKWTYALQWEVSDLKDRLNLSHSRMKAIGNYLTYKLNKFWSVGFRVEWLAFDGVDYSDYTLGLTWKPNKKVTIMPEIRFDHASDKTNKPFNYGNDREQFSGGITGIYVF
jgi:hypothetical protein